MDFANWTYATVWLDVCGLMMDDWYGIMIDDWDDWDGIMKATWDGVPFAGWGSGKRMFHFLFSIEYFITT